MRRHVVVIGLALLGLAAFAVLSGWAFFEASTLGGAAWSLGPLWPYVVGGVAVVGALVAFLMWLAFYSAGFGSGERIDPEGH